MKSPFANNKKARRRYRKFAHKLNAQATEYKLSGKRPDWAIDSFLSMAKMETNLAQAKKIKKIRSRTAR